MKVENIIHGLKAALLKCNAITPDNAEAIESLLNNQVKNDIEKYAQQRVRSVDEIKKASETISNNKNLGYGYKEDVVNILNWVLCGDEFDGMSGE